MDLPMFQKLISVTAVPQMIDALHETRTPTLPRPARYGLEEFAPNLHMIAEMIRSSTDTIRPIVITAPTIVCNCEIPGSPLSFGVMSTRQYHRQRGEDRNQQIKHSNLL